MSARGKTVVPFPAKLEGLERGFMELEPHIWDLLRACQTAEYVYHGEDEGRLDHGSLQLMLESLTLRATDLKNLYSQLHRSAKP
jgi:hypothetical protein